MSIKQRPNERKKGRDRLTNHLSLSVSRMPFSVSVYICIIDRLVSELDRRYWSFNDVCENFGFSNKINLMSPKDLRPAALSLKRKYNSDLEEDFVEQVVQFRQFVGDRKMTSMSSLQLLKLLRQ
ncbi:hypothetical protein ILYODFUR_034321 [Ilyodon furcidens]|uniref:Uncharacterized protein n=1 Tax=Ilyodon furcidens TaxID=33524 RepID=A0ABV0UCJ1_9TELE